VALRKRVRRYPNRDPELSRALEIVDREYGTPDAERRPVIPRVKRLGELFLFTPDEQVQLTALRDLIQRYIAQPKQPRPLSLAVFGPPGSGKSFAVKQILKQVKKPSKLKLPRIDVNLTQISDSDALANVLYHASGAADDTVPVIFFDEFDAARAGAPFGWLAWFLAPMQDGEFVHDGEVIELTRAVYVFAGGTADTLEQFSDFDSLPEFRRAKGPDFISRLRGFLDVRGPNAEPRMLRRAVLFRAEFMSRALRNGRGRFRADPQVIEAFLQAGRYRHGARSISAVVELSNIHRRKRHLRWQDLPKDHLLALHIDRGPLDPRSIGGTIALSGYGDTPDIEHWWSHIARRLWNEGATLSYAGRWQGTGGWLMRFLQERLTNRPPEPSADPHSRKNPAPWLESFLDDTPRERTSVSDAIPLRHHKRLGLKVTFASHLTDDERARLDRWLLSGLEHFRRRLAVAETSVARFVMAGATANYFGRFPGIPEEVMLTLAQEKPVYIAGGLGGAAVEVGSLLGLAHPRTGGVAASLRADPPQNERNLQTIANELRPGPWTDLPVTAAELVSFLRAHALGGPKWPDNGLSQSENRQLFVSKDSDEVAKLVVTGLLRRFA
jgi:SLOG cluster2/ATPase family associated with various cellular activities (AAA)